MAKQRDAVKIEQNRLKRILKKAEVSKERQEMLAPIIENTAWMRHKLEDARQKIKTTSIIIAYDNGGGQKGMRENPAFRGYESLFKAYMLGMGKILEALPPEAAAAEAAKVESDQPKTVLSMIRDKQRGA